MISGCQGYDRVYDIVLYHQSKPIQKIIGVCAKFAHTPISMMKTIVITILTTGNGASGKNFISLDISDFRQKNNCLKVFEMMKKSLHLQPQTIKTMRYSMNIITLEPKVSTGWILGCRVRYAHCSGN